MSKEILFSKVMQNHIIRPLKNMNLENLPFQVDILFIVHFTDFSILESLTNYISRDIFFSLEIQNHTIKY